ncbi:LysR family transcriptional regulator [Fodinicola feengrottensis]|uniref:LysR family transcriptional regulator n=1 Tax=Fodinicola feengrottensis TaxID=435914 RepID=A0ABN2HQN2_9ACTN|nr:LysR family transcriptional regulator [Fodinicola feengrottensis]
MTDTDLYNGEWTDQVRALSQRLLPFLAVATEQHVTRAAIGMGVPQPTVSRAIARLEEELGVALFARSGRGVRLTRHGRALLPAAERAARELAAGCQAVLAETDPDAGRVSFAFLHTMAPRTVPELLRTFRAQHPLITFTLTQASTDDIRERVRSGEIDLGLVSPGTAGPGIAVRPLATQPLVLMVPAGHRFASRRQVRLAEAATEAFICLEPQYGLRRICDDLCHAAGFTPRIAFVGQEVETARGLVAAGLGVSILPITSAETTPGAVAVRISSPVAARTICLIWPADRDDPSAVHDLHPPARRFREFLLANAGRLLAVSD